MARTVMTALGVAMSASAPMPACVMASALTVATGVASAPAPRPKALSAELLVAVLSPVASTVMAAARVTSPSSVATVPPSE